MAALADEDAAQTDVVDSGAREGDGESRCPVAGGGEAWVTLNPTILIAEAFADLRGQYARALPDGAAHLDRILARLGLPPSSTIVRFNMLRVSRAEAEEELRAMLVAQCPLRGLAIPPITQHPLLPDVLVLPCEGPRPVTPAEKASYERNITAIATING